MNHILVPLDGSSFAECALSHALAFAKAFNAEISLVHVLEQPAASLGLGTRVLQAGCTALASKLF